MRSCTLLLIDKPERGDIDGASGVKQGRYGFPAGKPFAFG